MSVGTWKHLKPNTIKMLDDWDPDPHCCSFNRFRPSTIPTTHGQYVSVEWVDKLVSLKDSYDGEC